MWPLAVDKAPYLAALVARGGGQNGMRPVQILRDDGRADIRRTWHDRHWAGPATAAADPWQGSDGGVRRSRHGVKSKNPAAPAVKREAEEDWGRVKWG